MNSVEKTLAVLRALPATDRPRRLADIAEQAGVIKTTTHRILQILAEHGYAVAHGEGSYSAGPALHTLAGNGMSERDLGSIAKPMLDNLARQTSHTVHFAVRSGSSAVYLAKVDSNEPYQMSSQVGARIALHCTAIGKALLANLPADDVRDVVAATAPLIRHTANTVVGVEDLMTELHAVRKRGFSVDNEENERNVRSVGAVVRDQNGAIGGISVSGLTFSLTEESVDALGSLTAAAAERISIALGMPKDTERATRP